MPPFKLKQFLLELICLTIAVGASAQTNFKNANQYFREGVVITLAGDTLRGQIDYQQWRQNPAAITFVQRAAEQTFTALDIQGFGVEGETYRARKVALDVSPHLLKDLRTSGVPTVVTDTTLFLQLLVEGKVPLYSLEDKNGKQHFFYQEQGRETKELSYFRYYHSESSLRMVTKENYKGQLTVLLQACEQQKLDPSIPYHAKKFVEFFEEYNSCLMGKEVKRQKSANPKGSWQLYAIAGTQYTSYEVEDWITGYQGTANGLSPQLGIAVKYVLPRNLGRYSVKTSLLLSRPRFQDVHTIHDVYGTEQDVYYYYDYKLNSLQLLSMLHYQLSLNSSLKPYLAIGPSLILYHNSTVSVSKTSEDGNGQIQPYGKNQTYELLPFIAGGSVAFGTSWKRLGLELRIHHEIKNAHPNGLLQAKHYSGLLSYKVFGK